MTTDSPASHQTQESQAKVERRRPGRPERVSAALLPVLRDPAALPRPAGEEEQRPQACEACRMPATLPLLSMAFQPIVDLAQHRIDAFEALVRGANGEGAATMLQHALNDNLYAFDQACRVKAIELATRLGLDRDLNINFLPNAVYEPRACIRATLDAARRHGLDISRLTFEIVETESLAESAHLRNIVRAYRSMGFRIALDDFGTGYSGLHRLVDLQPDIIKVDRCLVQDCDLDQTRLAVLANIVKTGAEIGVKVVIEGVERSGEAHALIGIGARFMQGYYFAKPAFERLVPEAEIFAPLANARSL